MKNFTLYALCAFLFTTNALFAQPTTAPTTPPARNASDVVAVFSEAYTEIGGATFNPGWSPSTTVNDVTIAGNIVKSYGAFNFQGIEFTPALNVGSMTKLHYDIWSSNCTEFDFYLINLGPTVEKKVTKTIVAGWNSFDIDLSLYSPLALGNIGQIKIEGRPFAYPTGTLSVYLDNIYFWKPANVPTITGFSVPAKLVGAAPFALTAPTSNSTGAFTYTSSNPLVATISGNTVTVVGAGNSTITANQAAAGAYAAGTTSAILTVSSPGPATAAPTPTRASSDVISLFSGAYTDVGGTNWDPGWGGTTIHSDVMIAGNATKKFGSISYQGTQFAPPINLSTANMTFLHFDYWSSSVNSFDVFLINIPPLTQAEQKVTITPTLSGWNSIDIPLSLYSSLNLTGIGQIKWEGRPAGGDVYLDNIYFYKAVVAPTAPTVAASDPTKLPVNVISLFSGVYTDVAGTNWFPDWGGQSTVVTEVPIAGNPTKRYASLSYQGVEFLNPVNASTMTNIHFDFWSSSCTAFKVSLINIPPLTQTEQAITVTTTLSGWNSIDIPLSSYNTINLAGIGQLKLEGTPSGTSIVYLDNIYFWKPAAIPVELVSFKGKTVNNTTVLNWNTASERDNKGFTIERSTNGTTYTAIGQVKGNGTTATAHNYTFTDATPSVGSNYYRLRQTDLSGKETLSSVVAVIFGKGGLLVKSTLVQNTLDITVGGDAATPLSIFNLSGQQVYNGKVQGTQSIDVSAFAAGLYIIRTATGEESRFVKQ